jgi:1-acyl-sn-glycerol-3-phosphate acyltransferase
VVGRENIPEKGPIIFAPNHRNALMDALAILSVTPTGFSTSFVARADIFKKKMIAAILHFIKIMPAFRMRDGYENLGRNNETFDMSSELLINGNALCIMPEGNQETEQFIRPLVKGIFRIAFATQEQCGPEKPVKIVPVGLDYGSIYKYGKHIIINIGKPVDISEYIETYRENQAQAMNELRQRLSDSLKSLTVDVASNENYEEILTATELAGFEAQTGRHFTIESFKLRQKAAKTLVHKEKTDTVGFQAFAENCRALAKQLKTLHLKPQALSTSKTSLAALALDAVLLCMTFPIFVQGFLLNFIPFFLPVYLRKNVFKAQYDGFFSSLHFGSGLLIFPIYYIIQTIVFAAVVPAPWWMVLLFVPFQYIIGKWAFRWYRNSENIRSAFLLQASNR